VTNAAVLGEKELAENSLAKARSEIAAMVAKREAADATREIEMQVHQDDLYTLKEVKIFSAGKANECGKLHAALRQAQAGFVYTRSHIRAT
jgi:hypothetical protein